MRPGEVVAGRFQIESIAGTGGMGTVYRARDVLADATVALKTLSVMGERDAARFAREAAVLAELAHPGIVRYVAHGLTPAHEQYIVMEWLDGETLHDRLGRGRLPVADAVAMTRAAAEALAVAHRRGIVHRDIKPMNLFLSDGNPANVKILDFGIARHVHQAGQLTNTGTMIGTPGYMAPEQVRGETALDARTDVFSLGCVLYRSLTGTSAFGGEHSLAIFAKILLEDVVHPSELAPEVPPELDAIVLQMIAKDREARFADGRAVADALGGFAPGDATVATSSGAPTRSSERSRTRPSGGISEAEDRLVSVVLSGPATGDTEPERLGSVATAFGGRLERIADGATMVLFAHAGVATDHATRAARCALALRDVLPGAPLVVASGRASIDRLVVGDVIDRAAAAIREALPGQIVLDDSTAGLLDERFVITERKQRRVLRGMRDGGEPVRTLMGRQTALVGRDRELAMLESLWAECVDESVSRAVLITAPPGGGKSRLRQELTRRALQRDDAAELIIGRADSVRAGSPFAMLADAIRRTAGVREGDAIDDQRASLAARVARTVSADADRVVHLLGEIAGVPFPSDASEALRAARADPIAKGDAMRTAWVDWLAAECADHPVLLVLEDLHWGDRPTVDFVDAALRQLAQRRLMVVALARPEIHDTFPKLWHERELQELRLSSLTKKACDRLVRDLLGESVADKTVQRIVERSAGNAFFLEELIRAVAEGRSDSLPDSVLSMLQARLDALGPDAKRALRAASVFGEVFWRDGVRALYSDAPDDALEELIQHELIAIAPESRIPGEIEYTFRHDLIREAAYATLGAGNRELGHRLAAMWLVDHGLRDPVALAEHFSRGGERDKAAEQWAIAAAHALEGNDNETALAHVQRGLDLGATGELAGELYLLRAEAHNWRGEHPVAAAAAEQAIALLPHGGPAWFRGNDELFFAAGRGGQIPRAVAILGALTQTTAAPGGELAQLRSLARAAIVMFRFGPSGVGDALCKRVEELASGLTIDLELEQRLHSLYALRARARGEAVASLQFHADALRACELTHNLREMAFTYLSWAGIYEELGAPEHGAPLLIKGIQIAERIGASTITTLLRFALALADFERGRHAEARDGARIAAEMAAASSDRAAEGLARWVIARIALASGDLATAQAEIDRALDTLSTFAEWRSFAVAVLAQIRLRGGDPAGARKAASEAMRLLKKCDGFEDGEALVRLADIETLDAVGDHDAAREATRVAIDRIRSRAARIDEAWRASWLAKGENAALLR